MNKTKYEWGEKKQLIMRYISTETLEPIKKYKTKKKYTYFPSEFNRDNWFFPGDLYVISHNSLIRIGDAVCIVYGWLAIWTRAPPGHYLITCGGASLSDSGLIVRWLKAVRGKREKVVPSTRLKWKETVQSPDQTHKVEETTFKNVNFDLSSKKHAETDA